MAVKFGSKRWCTYQHNVQEDKANGGTRHHAKFHKNIIFHFLQGRCLLVNHHLLCLVVSWTWCSEQMKGFKPSFQTLLFSPNLMQIWQRQLTVKNIFLDNTLVSMQLQFDYIFSWRTLLNSPWQLTYLIQLNCDLRRWWETKIIFIWPKTWKNGTLEESFNKKNVLTITCTSYIEWFTLTNTPRTRVFGTCSLTLF